MKTKIKILAFILFINSPIFAQLPLNIGDIPPGDSVVVTFEVQINAPFPSDIDQIVNQGLVSGSNFDPVMTDDPNTADAGDATATPIVSSIEDRFVLFAKKNIKMYNLKSSFGNVHANRDVKLYSRWNESTHTGNVYAGDDVYIKGDQIVEGNVSAGDTVMNKGTINGTSTSNAEIDLEELPELDYSAGGKSFYVRNKVQVLEPGSYNDVKVGRRGILEVSSGEYFLNKLYLNYKAKLRVDVSNGAVTINVVKGLRFGAKCEVEIVPSGANTELLTFNTMERDLGIGGFVSGTILAPNASIELYQPAVFKGSIAAKYISVFSGVILEHHSTENETVNLAKSTEDNIEQIDLAESNIPTEFALEQNFPNPFNPTTNISFALPEANQVELSIYNVQGQRIRTLISGSMDAGNHTIQWNALNDTGAKVSSGVYIYLIRAGNFIESRKMVLMK